MADLTANPRYTRREVQSSFIAWVGWSNAPGDNVLIVSMHNGKRYLYANVSRQRAVAMSRARSVGRYYCRNIKGQHSSFRLHVDPPRTRKDRV